MEPIDFRFFIGSIIVVIVGDKDSLNVMKAAFIIDVAIGVKQISKNVVFIAWLATMIVSLLLISITIIVVVAVDEMIIVISRVVVIVVVSGTAIS